jgi:hypothetical protein
LPEAGLLLPLSLLFMADNVEITPNWLYYNDKARDKTRRSDAIKRVSSGLRYCLVLRCYVLYR